MDADGPEDPLLGFSKIISCDPTFEEQLFSWSSSSAENISKTLQKLNIGCNANRAIFGFRQDQLVNLLPVTVKYGDGSYGPTFANMFCFYCNWRWNESLPQLSMWSAFLANKTDNYPTMLPSWIHAIDDDFDADWMDLYLEIVYLLPPAGFFPFPQNGPRSRMPCLFNPRIHAECEQRVPIGRDVVLCTGKKRSKLYQNPHYALCDADRDDYLNCSSEMYLDPIIMAVYTGLASFTSIIIDEETSSTSSANCSLLMHEACHKNTLAISSLYRPFTIDQGYWSDCSANDVIGLLEGADRCSAIRDASTAETKRSFHGAKRKRTPKYTLYTWLTVFGLSISVVSLVLTLLLVRYIRAANPTYRLTPQLHLVGALLGYNLTYLVRSHLKAFFCKAAAMALHFFLIATFFWSSCVALRVFWSLARLEGQLSPANGPVGYHRRWIMPVVTAFCWGTPLCFVLVCGVIDLAARPGSIGYGADGSCWIGVEASRLAVFAIPSFVAAFFNAILLTASLSIVAFLRRSVGNIRSNGLFKTRVEMAFVALRLLATVGTQWILGFVLFIDHDNAVVETLFTITTTLQGFFVFLAIITTGFMRQRLAIWARFVFRRLRGPARVAPNAAPMNGSSSPRVPAGDIPKPGVDDAANDVVDDAGETNADEASDASRSTDSTRLSMRDRAAAWRVLTRHAGGLGNGTSLVLQSIDEMDAEEGPQSTSQG